MLQRGNDAIMDRSITIFIIDGEIRLDKNRVMYYPNSNNIAEVAYAESGYF